MQRTVSPRKTRRLAAHYLGIARTSPALASLDSPGWQLRWLGCHGGAGVSTLAALTGLGQDAGQAWPADDGTGVLPVVLVCRASATGTAAAAAVIEQKRNVAALAHVDLLGFVAVAASPGPVTKLVSQRLMLMAGWVRHHWWVGWCPAYLAADDPRAAGPSPDLVALRGKLSGVLPAGRP